MNSFSDPMLSRRRFLQLAGSSVFLASVPSLLRGKVGDLDTVSLFHTTDLHGNVVPTSTYDGISDVGGIARCATRIAQWRRLQPDHLLVDLGDLYQGTKLGYRTNGQAMIKCLNHLQYDAWVLGNHEFDWGIEAVDAAIANSDMPVITANSSFDGRDVWAESNFGETPVLPYLLKEVGGYRIAFIGLTTPGMPNWFLPDLLGGFSAADPVPVARAMIDLVKAQGADAIIVGTHMGIRPWSSEDDAANRLDGLTKACPEIDMIIAGHTHRNLSHERVNGVPYSQANYFGIHLGRLDLIFDRESRRLISVQPMTSYMDSSVPVDPAVVALVADDVEEAEAYLSQPVGEFADTLHIDNAPGVPSEVERLIGGSIMYGLAERGVEVDAVIHGLLFMDSPVEAGPKSVGDMWSILPFENFLVTAEVPVDEFVLILREVFQGRQLRGLVGLTAIVEGRGENLQITSLLTESGEPFTGDKVRFAVNSYDAASGGARFPLLREIISQSGANRKLHRWQSRALLADYVREFSPITVAKLPSPPFAEIR